MPARVGRCEKNVARPTSALCGLAASSLLLSSFRLIQACVIHLHFSNAGKQVVREVPRGSNRIDQLMDPDSVIITMLPDRAPGAAPEVIAFFTSIQSIVNFSAAARSDPPFLKNRLTFPLKICTFLLFAK